MGFKGGERPSYFSILLVSPELHYISRTRRYPTKNGTPDPMYQVNAKLILFVEAKLKVKSSDYKIIRFSLRNQSHEISLPMRINIGAVCIFLHALEMRFYCAVETWQACWRLQVIRDVKNFRSRKSLRYGMSSLVNGPPEKKACRMNCRGMQNISATERVPKQLSFKGRVR